MADLAKHIMVGVDYGGGFIAEVDPSSVKVTPGLAEAIQKCGAIHPQIKLGLTAEPTIELSFFDIKALSGPALLSVGSPLKLYFRALSDTLGFGTGYISVTCTSGMAVPTTLGGGKGKLATLGCTVHLTSTDGDAAPFTVGTTSATLSAPTDFYCLGIVTLTTALAGVTEASLDFGFKVAKDTGENGFPFPRKCWIADQDAKITTTVEGLAEATQARSAIGTAETTVTITFRKVTAALMPANSGGYLVTGQKAGVHVGTISGGRPSTVQLIADLIATAFDGTNYLQFASVA
jgi:hypothetical protein